MTLRLCLGLMLLGVVCACQQRGPVDLEALGGRARGGDQGAIRQLVGLLEEENSQLNARVYGMLLELGAKAVPVLLEQVGSEKTNLREHAIAALGNQKVSAAVPAIAKVLGDRQFRRRYVAAWALGEIGDPSAVPALVAALDDADSEVRKVTVRALIKHNRAAVEPLVAFLSAASGVGEVGAVRALGDIGDPRALEVLLSRTSGPIRAEVILALGKLKDPRAEAVLLAALRDEESQTRMNAAMALGPLGAKAAVPPLRQALEDEVLVVREWAARSLEMITGEHVTYRNEQGEQVAPYNIYH